jgi:Proline racemase
MWQVSAVLPSRIATVDYHTGGEPFRIVAEPPAAIPGATVAERRARAIEDADVQALRAVLCSEPRAHAACTANSSFRQRTPKPHLGVLFWHKDGFSTACGHATTALGVWAVDSGRVAAPETGSYPTLPAHQPTSSVCRSPRQPRRVHRARPGDQVGTQRQRARCAPHRPATQRHLRDDLVR